MPLFSIPAIYNAWKQLGLKSWGIFQESPEVCLNTRSSLRFQHKGIITPTGKYSRLWDYLFKTLFHSIWRLKSLQLHQGVCIIWHSCLTGKAFSDRLLSSYDSTPNTHTYTLHAAARISREIRQTWTHGDCKWWNFKVSALRWEKKISERSCVVMIFVLYIHCVCL